MHAYTVCINKAIRLFMLKKYTKCIDGFVNNMAQKYLKTMT